MPVITVENAQIKTAAVEIKTLTISGKQVTLSVFRQIQEENIFDCDSLHLKGIPWGNINYFFGDDKNCDGTNWFNIVWQKGKELRRCALRKVYRSYFLEHGGVYTCNDNKIYFGDFLLKKLNERKQIGSTNYVLNEKIDKLKKDIDYEKHWNKLDPSEEELNELIIAEAALIDNDKEMYEANEFISSEICRLNKILESFLDLPHLFIAI